MTHKSTACTSARSDARGSSFRKRVSILTCAWNGKVGLGMGPRACSISCRPDYCLDMGKSKIKAHFCVLCFNSRVATFVFEDLWAWFLDVGKSRWWCWKCFGNTLFGHFEGIRVLQIPKAVVLSSEKALRQVQVDRCKVSRCPGVILSSKKLHDRCKASRCCAVQWLVIVCTREWGISISFLMIVMYNDHYELMLNCIILCNTV